MTPQRTYRDKVWVMAWLTKLVHVGGQKNGAEGVCMTRHVELRFMPTVLGTKEGFLIANPLPKSQDP